MPQSTAPKPINNPFLFVLPQPLSPIYPLSRMNGNGLKLDLKLNLSPPRVSHPMVVSPPIRSSTVSPSSSCVSSENQEDGRRFCSSPEAASMVLVGCPRCLMYVMLAEGEPKCPKCKSTVLLNFFYDHQSNNARRA
ncbi:uncharacterized protein LOC116030165 isoform X1 [Ipomoea triloba]|uniref:uncharacterized protein LOC116030165 isoform X1 n=1 Tax=Ipomoea triloba TaxID=35885 RepID=UPI00125E3443|nr:uncharacterized protein LOC116030165 isoform X1 [Ipomoea triloba]GMC88797.1 ras guanine nucleotide exchange factor P-like [Ipomoea batatas]